MRMPSFVSGIAGVAFSIIFVIIFISFLFDFRYCRHILSTLPICRILPAAKHRQNAKAPLPAKTAGLKNKERNEHDGESVLCIEEIFLSSSMDGKPRPTSGCPSVLRLPDVHKESETPSTSGEGERKFTESSLVYIIPDFPAGANFCRIFLQPREVWRCRRLFRNFCKKNKPCKDAQPEDAP